MFLAILDFSKDNLLLEQLNIDTFYELPVLDLCLFDHQLRCFCNLNIDVVYAENLKNTHEHFSVKIKPISFQELNLQLLSMEPNETVVLFRNDMFFEGELKDEFFSFSENDLTFLTDAKGLCFAVTGTANVIKSTFIKHKNIFEFKKKTSIKFNGYVKQLLSIKNYKELIFDILNSKLCYKSPYVAEGVFVKGEVPKGDFSITPPVYLGECVQIENGSHIGPNVAIYDETLVSKNSLIKDSVLFKNVYISSECFVDGAVFSSNTSLKRGAAVYSDSVIGSNSVIAENITVENGSIIPPDIRFDKNLIKKNNHNFLNGKGAFEGLGPDEAARLGLSVGAVLRKPKILIAGDGELNATSVKLAFMSGLLVSGAECFDIGNTYESMIYYSSYFCECDYCVFVRGKGGGTNLNIFDSKLQVLSESDCVNLLDFYFNKKMIFAKENEMKSIRQIRGITRMYVRVIKSILGKNVGVNPVVICSNRHIRKIIEEALCNYDGINEKCNWFKAIINDSGTALSIEYYNKRYSHSDLKRLVAFFVKLEKDNTINKELFEKDSIFLLMKILNIYSKHGNKFSSLFENIPDFYIVRKNVETSLKPGEVAQKLNLLKNSKFENNEYKFTFKNALVKIGLGNDYKKMKVYAASENHSFSEELCDFFYDLLNSQ